jgi:hypothetical protein
MTFGWYQNEVDTILIPHQPPEHMHATEETNFYIKLHQDIHKSVTEDKCHTRLVQKVLIMDSLSSSFLQI